MAVILDNAHWTDRCHTQRITRQEWIELLLEHRDVIVYRGALTQLKIRSLGAGVVEVSKDWLDSKECTELSGGGNDG